MELRSDGAMKAVTVRNCYIYQVCFDGFIRLICVQSIIMGRLISYCIYYYYYYRHHRHYFQRTVVKDSRVKAEANVII